MPYDVDAAASHARNHALPVSSGYCARYVRQAIAAGGISVANTAHAKDYGAYLMLSGFTEYGSEPAGGYQKGDVVVIEAFGTHQSGHMQMYDGQYWISDFRQMIDFWPGQAWRIARPGFKVYRYEQN